MRSVPLLAVTGLLSVTALAACGGEDKPADPNALTITSTDTECEVSKTELAAGSNTFKILNKGTQVTEVYFYGPDGKIVSEKENIGPGTNYDITVSLSSGDQQIACKPGMVGDGIKQNIKVSGQASALDPRLTKAVADYRAYIDAQIADTMAKTQKFAESVKKGDVDGAKALYAQSRFGWESIEPVAEAFGDIDPKVDLREADLESGDTWSGWHKIEKALWVKKTTKGEEGTADQLLADLKTLQDQVHTVDITPASMANGAKELLDEVATGKITGEEEAFSHTDLVDFQANLDGAQKVFELLKPVVVEKDAALDKTLTDGFATLQTLLKKYDEGNGAKTSYDKVKPADRKELSDAVNALAEPLSKLAATVG
ncbi:iron uptake system protein EfeO [Actinocorallia longicatena]|uniref:Iron uptake system protein EfeO n=1 Tax=Actinocorallia longicatena TaxID=111803 RepID=A0ABP6QKS9_9ACTN